MFMLLSLLLFTYLYFLDYCIYLTLYGVLRDPVGITCSHVSRDRRSPYPLSPLRLTFLGCLVSCGHSSYNVVHIYSSYFQAYSPHTISFPLKMSTPAPTQKTITIGTRKSKLALLQTNLVLDALKKAFPQYEYKIFSKETAGDLNTTIALRDFTTKNLWTEELEELMIDGQVDVIVHSLKGLIMSQSHTA